MRSLNRVFGLLPVFASAIILAPTADDVALAQSDVKLSPRDVIVQEVAPEQRESSGATNARDPLATDTVTGSAIERVDTVSAGDRAVGAADGLSSKIEFFKGGEVVVLTVVQSDESAPIAARVDSVKTNRAGPTSLIPFRAPAAGTGGRNGPTNLIPSRLRATEAALRNRPVGPVPSPVGGATLQDQPAGDGILVATIEPGSPAWQDGLRRADVIASANRVRVRDTAMLAATLASAGRTVVLEVRRNGNEQVVVLHR